jgi:indolepyruvate ferredoxin oxidoreductase beta subunit
MLEAARYTEYLKTDGQIVVNTQNIDPMPVITGAAEYPTNLQEKIQAANIKIDALDCLTLAEQAGTSKAVNIVLMGRLSKYMDFPLETWLQAIEKLVKPQFLEINKKAFLLGRGDN